MFRKSLLPFVILLVFVTGISCKKEPIPQDGQITFFVRSDFGVGAIKLYIDNQYYGIITQPSPNGVTCGSNEGVTVKKQPGSYSWRAEGVIGGSWNGTFVVVDGICDKYEITGGVVGAAGDVVFWAPNNVVNNCGNITVTCNGLTRQITTYNASAPDCNASGIAKFYFLAGTYNYTASCDYKTWSGTITVLPNNCVKTELTEAAAAKYSYISFTNTTYTNAKFVFNGQTKYADPGTTVVFYGLLNTNSNGSATTNGTYSNGSQLGVQVTSNFNYTFPGTIGTGFNQSFFAGNSVFFLRIRNTHLTQNISQVIVNQGLTSQITENINIPNNGTTYALGYFNAFTNSNIRVVLANGNTIDYTGLGLPFTNNQAFTLNVM